MDFTAINQEIVQQLIDQFGFVREGDFLRKGKCPQCQKHELWTSANRPITLKCPRANNCGWEGKTRELFAELFKSNRSFKPTPENPNAQAVAWLRTVRNIDTSKINGWFSQGRFGTPNGDTSGTVKFTLPNGSTFERLFFPVTAIANGSRETRKQHFTGKHAGLAWKPPTLDDNQEIWITEACLDSCALAMVDVQSISCLSVTNFPQKTLDQFKPKTAIVWAFDGDQAGRKHALKWHKKALTMGLTSSIAVPPAGQDWGELQQEGKLDQQAIEEARYQGTLLAAATVQEKALLINQKTQASNFPVEFNGWTFWASVGDSLKLHKIGNFTMQVLFFHITEITDERSYFIKITINGRDHFGNLPPSALGTSTSFRTAIASIAGNALFTGDTSQMCALLDQQMAQVQQCTVLDHVGFSKEHETVMLADAAIHNGKVFKATDDGHFQMPFGILKSKLSSPKIELGDEHQYQGKWFQTAHQAFGPNATLAIAFLVGTFFAQQIRTERASFPFLEITGQPGSGKTTLVEFLYKLTGRIDYEGFDPFKATPASRARSFSQVSNMPVTLMEGDRETDSTNARAFDWNEIKSLYNGRSTRSRALKTTGLDTFEPPFRGALIIVQNEPIHASTATLERIVPLVFTKKTHSFSSKQAADKLAAMSVKEVSWFFAKCNLMAKKILAELIPAMVKREHELMADLNNIRMAKNFGQIMALVDILPMVLPIQKKAIKAAHELLHTIALGRETELAGDTHPVRHFWQTVQFLMVSKKMQLNHSANADDGIIALNLNQIIESASKAQQELKPLRDLRDMLRSSQLPLFTESKAVHSVVWNRTVKCMVFQTDQADKSFINQPQSVNAMTGARIA